MDYSELKDILKTGDWIFTCSMKPVQFKEVCGNNWEDYFESEEEYNKLTENEKFNFIHSDFLTIGGGKHSFKSCGCEPISEKYALWFLENTIDDLFYGDWNVYENLVKQKCEEAGIMFEGI
jgi:hypothetical protein